MDSHIKLISVSFIINLINVCSVSAVNDNLLDNIILFNNSAIESFIDIVRLHHAFVTEDQKWDNGRISFEIDGFNAYEVGRILAAMDEIERSSCIRFEAHNPRNGPNYVMITKCFDGSRSTFSCIGCHRKGAQLLQICGRSINEHTTILAALLNTIGFGHHHQRADRDLYIDIHLEDTNFSINSIVHNFGRLVQSDPRVQYSTPFDFDSVMLNDQSFRSVSGKPIITSKIGCVKMPTNKDRGLSKYDKILLNKFYNCAADKQRETISNYWFFMPRYRF